MSKSTEVSKTLADIIKALSTAATGQQETAADSAAEDLHDSLIRIPRSPQFWIKELKDLARCRAIVDASFEAMIAEHVDSIDSKVECVIAKNRITTAFLESILNLSYSATIDFIDAFEQRLRKFGHDLPDSLAVYRIQIGLGDGTDDNDVDSAA